ncbi:MAG: hypothetical protein Q8K59_01175 [Nitrosomonas sp.]|nr:hypothetical protein [Nitrosomonas sp.]MDP1949713.1 hypothetical protein [Nitrosomonas sp.]
MTKRGKQASRKAAARKYGFLEVPLRHSQTKASSLPYAEVVIWKFFLKY